MTRRRVLLLGTVAIVVALVAAVSVVRPWPSAITEENAAQIKRGMTLEEVEAILGGPPRNERGGGDDIWVHYYRISSVGLHFDQREWIGPEVGIRVVFSDDRVVDSDIGETMPPEERYFEAVRQWFGL